MGMTEDFEASLQVLRGFDTDISLEVNEIKVNLLKRLYLTVLKTMQSLQIIPQFSTEIPMKNLALYITRNLIFFIFFAFIV